MKFSVSFLVLCILTMCSVLWYDQQHLPPQIASHFDLAGNADNPVPRSAFLPFALVTGLGLPAVIIFTVYSIRFLPGSNINVPHPEYWRAPENYPRACAIIFDYSLWFGSAFILWWTAFFHLVAAANHLTPPHLDTTLVNISTGIFLAFIACWLVALYLRFRQIPPANP